MQIRPEREQRKQQPYPGAGLARLVSQEGDEGREEQEREELRADDQQRRQRSDDDDEENEGSAEVIGSGTAQIPGEKRQSRGYRDDLRHQKAPTARNARQPAQDQLRQHRDVVPARRRRACVRDAVGNLASADDDPAECW